MHAPRSLPDSARGERVPNWDAPQFRLARRLGRAATVAAALAELATLAKPFGDDELSRRLWWCQGRMLEHLMQARRAAEAQSKEAC